MRPVAPEPWPEDPATSHRGESRRSSCHAGQDSCAWHPTASKAPSPYQGSRRVTSVSLCRPGPRTRPRHRQIRSALRAGRSRRCDPHPEFRAPTHPDERGPRKIEWSLRTCHREARKSTDTDARSFRRASRSHGRGATDRRIRSRVLARDCPEACDGLARRAGRDPGCWSSRRRR